MFYTITPLTEHTGLEFRGLDLTERLDPEISDALNRAFVDYHVLVIRDQTFTPEQLIASAELFGELQPHDKKELHVPGYPQINYVSNEQTVPGKRYISGETFHTDHSNHRRRRRRHCSIRCRCRRAGAIPNTSTCTRPMKTSRTRRSSGSTG